MGRKALVIGLGQFGMTLARSLVEREFEVVAVDVDAKRAGLAREFAEVLEFDAVDRDALMRVNPARYDVCVCALGEAAREASILCTAQLRELGARSIVARASDDLHGRILTAVGANQVINPEMEAGAQAVFRIANRHIRESMILGHGFYLVTMDAPPAFIGHSLAELALPSHFRLNVVTLRGQGAEQMELPVASRVIRKGDVLTLAGPQEAIAALSRFT